MDDQIQTPPEQHDPLDAASDSPKTSPEVGTNGDNLLEAKLEELTNALQRERADFQNFKKRIEREQDALRHKIGGDMLKKFLPIVDDFERAMEAIPSDQPSGDWLTGMNMILRKMHTILEAEGVQVIHPLGEAFDPNYHEAIGTDEASEDYPSQHVSAVLQRGYRQGERVLRPAMVRVAE